MSNDTRTCSRCMLEKPIGDYYTHKKSGKPRAECKSCANARSRKHYADNPDYYAGFAKTWRQDNREKSNATSAASRKRKRAEVYGAWFKHQDGKCAVCDKPQDSWESMHLDHDHRTGVGRGLCCRTCNYLLGMADDDREILAKAIAYLDAHSPDLSLPKGFTKWHWWNHLPPVN